MTETLQEKVLLEQYKHFRNWIAEAQKQRDEAARFAIVANGALAAWIATAKDPAVISYFLPLAVTGMLFAYWRGLRKKVIDGGSFIARMEENAGLNRHTGAELMFRAEGDPNARSKIWKTREAPVWIGLFLFGIVYLLLVGGAPIGKVFGQYIGIGK